MRMTQALVDAIATAVIRDLPVGRDYDAEARSLISAAAMKRIPPELQSWVEKRPDLFNMLHVWTPGSLNTVAVAGSSQEGRRELLEKDAKLRAKLDALSQAKSDHGRLVSDLYGRVKNAIGAFSTVKAAREALPEFAKYFPEARARPGASLPAVRGTVEELVKAGWPDKSRKRTK